MAHVRVTGGWKPVEIDPVLKNDASFADLISFEELTDYNIESTDTPGQDNLKNGQTVKSKSTMKRQREPPCDEKDAIVEDCPVTRKRKKKKRKLPAGGGVSKHNADSPPKDMTAWRDLFVPEPVLRAMEGLSFVEPTPIQMFSLPPAIRDRRDVVGAAETGSGKTLAFGIPLIHNILSYYEEKERVTCVSDAEAGEDGDDSADGQNVSMRNTAGNVRVSCEEDDGLDASDLEDGGGEQEDHETAGDGHESKPLLGLILTPTRELAIQIYNHLRAAAKHTSIKFAVVVGGMSVQKQERVLRKCPEVVIATPGRLWELVQQNEPHLYKVRFIRTLVVDEADRMIEKGHFQELSQLMELINSDPEKTTKRQIFVFSATLTMVHVMPKRIKLKKRAYAVTKESKLESLITAIGLKNKPKVIDLSRETGTAETLSEARINCTADDKDVYLYYLIRRYGGRSLVFCNSKDCLRRLVSVTTLLGLKPWPLHADMNQRQRLKNLDRFRDNSDSLMLATDVAARGLDIPNVQHVIHYQVPRTNENYVHRSGRTARALKEGVSVMLVGPSDMKYYRNIINSLNKGDELTTFPVQMDYIPQCKERVSLACQIDKLEHTVARQRAENSWFRRAAEEMDVVLDDKLMNDMGDSSEQAQKRRHLTDLRDTLTGLLRETLVPKHFSGKYITKGGTLATPFMEDQGLQTTAIGAIKEEAEKFKLLKKSVVKQVVMPARTKSKRKRRASKKASS